jgi:hypothetical protein
MFYLFIQLFLTIVQQKLRITFRLFTTFWLAHKASPRLAVAWTAVLR